MNLGGNKTTELTGMGDSKQAVTTEVSATPEVVKRRKNRFDRENERDLIEKTPVEETQLSLPSTIPYWGSSVNEVLLEAIGEIESGQIVPAVGDDMEAEYENEN